MAGLCPDFPALGSGLCGAGGKSGAEAVPGKASSRFVQLIAIFQCHLVFRSRYCPKFSTSEEFYSLAISDAEPFVRVSGSTRCNWPVASETQLPVTWKWSSPFLRPVACASLAPTALRRVPALPPYSLTRSLYWRGRFRRGMHRS